jgi:hypothetical protein
LSLGIQNLKLACCQFPIADCQNDTFNPAFPYHPSVLCCGWSFLSRLAAQEERYAHPQFLCARSQSPNLGSIPASNDESCPENRDRARNVIDKSELQREKHDPSMTETEAGR